MLYKTEEVEDVKDYKRNPYWLSFRSIISLPQMTHIKASKNEIKTCLALKMEII